MNIIYLNILDYCSSFFLCVKIDICMLLGLSSLIDAPLASPPFSRSKLTLKGINGASSQKR